jgi:hypothetical protein
LDAEDEVVSVGVGRLAALYRFDDGILRATGGDAQAIAGDADGLMMAGVDRQAKKAILLRRLFGGNDGAEERIRRNGSGMGDSDTATGGVVDWQDIKVLDQSSTTPDVEGLSSEADREDGFVEIVGVLDEELVHIFAGGVGRGALGDRLLTVFVRVDIRWAAREENGLTGVDQVSDLGRSSFEGDLDGVAATALNSRGIHGPGALVIGEVGAGRDGNGDARLHS